MVLVCSLRLKTKGTKGKGKEKSHPKEGEGSALAGAVERWERRGGLERGWGGGEEKREVGRGEEGRRGGLKRGRGRGEEGRREVGWRGEEGRREMEGRGRQGRRGQDRGGRGISALGLRVCPRAFNGSPASLML